MAEPGEICVFTRKSKQLISETWGTSIAESLHNVADEIEEKMDQTEDIQEVSHQEKEGIIQTKELYTKDD